MSDPADRDSQLDSEGSEVTAAPPESESPRTFATFLEQVPPGHSVVVADVLSEYSNPSGTRVLARPELKLHCQNCNGERRFINNRSISVDPRRLSHCIVLYTCKNCEGPAKVYALHIFCLDDEATVEKVGERPAFGPPLPPRLVTMLRDERELLAKGLRCENQGLGVGAFVYYRRVIELQKHRLFDQIMKVAKVTNAPSATIARLQAAQQERQFEKAMREIQSAVPEVLLIRGQNPLTLLHDALSEGVHGLTDEECLTRATVIRTVLVALAERIGLALQDDRELTDAVNTLMNLRAERERERKSAPPPTGT